MQMVILALAYARLYQVRWLEHRANRALRNAVRLNLRADRIRRREHLRWGLATLEPNASWRVPDTEWRRP